jgi:3-methyladenine DNA glycosylase AlkD
MSKLQSLTKDLESLANPTKAKILSRFFKTGPGEYGHGDIFLGIPVPLSRTIANRYKDLLLSDISQLLSSKIHEHRLIALLILVYQFQHGDPKTQQQIFKFYLASTSRINNWDLVDLSADKIVGEYLVDKKDFSLLKKLALSKNIWERRIAILSTFASSKRGNPLPTLTLSHLLISDPHDLIHKATGWMLRECGKRNGQVLIEKFLQENYSRLSRTTLRYAIEKFPKIQKEKYLQGKFL